MRDIAFSSFQDIVRLCRDRSIALFGAGVTAGKTARALKVPHGLIVDNNDNLWGTEQLGVQVRQPSILPQHRRW